MKKKLVIAAISTVLVLALGITGVVAYLTAKSDPVDNVFYLSDNVKITLDEAPVEKIEDDYVADEEADRVTQNTYEAVYPGAEMPKDPTVHLQDGAADAYVRVKVTVTNGVEWLPLLNGDRNEAFKVLTNDTVGAGWSITAVEDVESDVVYTLTYEKRLDLEEETADRPQDTTPVFTTIKFPATFTYEQINDLFNKDGSGKLNFEVDVIAEAMQAEGFDSATEAFAAYQA